MLRDGFQSVVEALQPGLDIRYNTGLAGAWIGWLRLSLAVLAGVTCWPAAASSRAALNK